MYWFVKVLCISCVIFLDMFKNIKKVIVLIIYIRRKKVFWNFLCRVSMYCLRFIDFGIRILILLYGIVNFRLVCEVVRMCVNVLIIMYIGYVESLFLIFKMLWLFF